jgi:HSP20 family protein
MTKVEVTKSNATPVVAGRDLFSVMRGEIDRLFERFELGVHRMPTLFRHHNGHDAIMLPELDVHDSGTSVSVEAELPGVAEKDVTVMLADGVLTIKGEKKDSKEEKHDNYYLAERSYGAFERSVRLPDGIDETKIEASFEKGVLKITAAKKPEAVKAARKIEIKQAS